MLLCLFKDAEINSQDMSAKDLWGSMGSLANSFMAKFGNGVSQGMNTAVSAVSDTVGSISEGLFNDGEEHFFEEDRSVCVFRWHHA